jgi:hypothetical protein
MNAGILQPVSPPQGASPGSVVLQRMWIFDLVWIGVLKLLHFVRKLLHHCVESHCPAKYGTVERFNRTLREGMEEQLIESGQDVERIVGEMICHCNEDRLHGALGLPNAIQLVPRQS